MPAIAQNFIKLNASVLLAALITFLLFYFMPFLIEAESDMPQTISVIRRLDAMDPEFDPVLDIKEERPSQSLKKTFRS